MSGDVVEFTASSRFGPGQEAPPLPIEQHIVAAALMAERLRVLADQIVLILRHMPRNFDVYAGVHDEALTAWCEIDEHYRAYLAVLECRGQG
jgi:hypothetical protein